MQNLRYTWETLSNLPKMTKPVGRVLNRPSSAKAYSFSHALCVRGFGKYTSGTWALPPSCRGSRIIPTFAEVETEAYKD